MNGPAIEKYEQIMMEPNTHFYLSGTDSEKEEDALSIIRYIVTDLLGWTPQEAMICMNSYIASKMKIDILLPYISFSKDVDRNHDYDFVIHKAFPRETYFQPQKKIIRLYQRLINGEISKYPKSYFNKTGNGYTRARCILLYIVQSKFVTDKDRNFVLFRFFANNSNATKKLKEWKMSAACKTLYNGNALDFLRDTLEDTPETEFLYNNFSFQKIWNEENNRVKKKMTSELKGETSV